MMESTECAVEINLKGTSDVKKKKSEKAQQNRNFTLETGEVVHKI